MRKSNTSSFWRLAVKVFIVLIFFAYFYGVTYKATDHISLLAVAGDKNERGSIVELWLNLKKGTGNMYINLDSLKEIDTQLSILNAKEVACDLFGLNCNDYDYFFTFETGSEILQGASGGAAVAMLMVDLLQGKKIRNDIAITGTISPSGIIGSVAGIDAKVKAAKAEGKKIVFIPYFGKYNNSVEGIKVIRVLDVFDLYKEVNGEEFKRKRHPLNLSVYLRDMKSLAVAVCNRTVFLNESLKGYSENNSIITRFRNSLNNGISSLRRGNYYAAGSFCFNANIFGEYFIENSTYKDVIFREKYTSFKEEYQKEVKKVYSKEFVKDIKTYEDMQVYFLVLSRLDEVGEYLKKVNLSANSSLGRANNAYYYSYAKERFFTVKLWELLINHRGGPINFDKGAVNKACQMIKKEAVLKNEFIKTFGVDYSSEITQLSTYDPFLCFYKGLEVLGKINAVSNIVGVNESLLKEYDLKLINISYERIELKTSKNGFPIIPYIYYEYAKELVNSDPKSSFIYVNYVLSFVMADSYLNRGASVVLDNFVNLFIYNLFRNWVVVLLLLIVLVLI